METIEQVLGEYNPDGSIKREPILCAVTGRKVFDSTPTVKARVPGTNYFYRTITNSQMTEARLAELVALTGGGFVAQGDGILGADSQLQSFQFGSDSPPEADSTRRRRSSTESES